MGGQELPDPIINKYGAHLSKDEVRDALIETKRINDTEASIILGNNMIKMSQVVLIGKEAWNRKGRKDMREKYFLAFAQFRKLDVGGLQARRRLQGA